jgi:hypothetical protein
VHGLTIKQAQAVCDAHNAIVACQAAALRGLLACYEEFQASSGNMEEAYYKLAKYAYPQWQAARAAISPDAVTAVNSYSALQARVAELEDENAKLWEALKSVPRKPGVTCTSHEWDLDDQAQGWSDAFHTSQVRSCRSVGYDKGMQAGKAARAALQGGSNG